MTQTGCESEAKSPHSLLLDSAGNNVQASESDSLLHGVTNVFAISPETALQLLCNNVEKLRVYFAQSSSTDQSGSTPTGYDTPTEEQAGEAVGLHCADAGNGTDRSSKEVLQLTLLSRKFLSRNVPPIPLKDYLLRLHRYCPMSTAVFIATSFYITRMALVDKVLRVTPKNAHRLVLAGLLVATKALEDLSWPHSRVAKVGGVSEQELSKLEISFCFLVNFELRVDAQMLMDEAILHRRGP
ncbi:hypothetical protein N7512_005734 [Penicillium capsulatum]|nr:hypothetical protein N7512_005734 [Penicillium capsulatum]